jgi:hypothetical protein
MKRIAVLVTAGLLAMPLLAQERIYLYVSYRDAIETSFRHKLDCIDTACKLVINNTERNLRLTAEQKQQLLHALQVESKQFDLVQDPAPGDKPIKVKFRYDTPGRRLEIERRLPADQPAELTPAMLRVIQTQLGLDLTQPLVPRAASSEAMDVEPARQEPHQ